MDDKNKCGGENILDKLSRHLRLKRICIFLCGGIFVEVACSLFESSDPILISTMP